MKYILIGIGLLISFILSIKVFIMSDNPYNFNKKLDLICLIGFIILMCILGTVYL